MSALLPHHSPGSVSTPGVVVDFDEFAPNVDGIQASIDDLIAWVSNCPRTSAIKVYLPSVAHRAAMQKLQRSLLSMGCTVTVRQAHGGLCRFRPS